MKKALKIVGGALGFIFRIFAGGVLQIGHFAVNCVGVLICAITEK